MSNFDLHISSCNDFEFFKKTFAQNVSYVAAELFHAFHYKKDQIVIIAENGSIKDMIFDEIQQIMETIRGGSMFGKISYIRNGNYFECTNGSIMIFTTPEKLSTLPPADLVYSSTSVEGMEATDLPNLLKRNDINNN